MSERGSDEPREIADVAGGEHDADALPHAASSTTEPASATATWLPPKPARLVAVDRTTAARPACSSPRARSVDWIVKPVPISARRAARSALRDRAVDDAEQAESDAPGDHRAPLRRTASPSGLPSAASRRAGPGAGAAGRRRGRGGRAAGRRARPARSSPPPSAGAASTARRRRAAPLAPSRYAGGGGCGHVDVRVLGVHRDRLRASGRWRSPASFCVVRVDADAAPPTQLVDRKRRCRRRNSNPDAEHDASLDGSGRGIAGSGTRGGHRCRPACRRKLRVARVLVAEVGADTRSVPDGWHCHAACVRRHRRPLSSLLACAPMAKSSCTSNRAIRASSTRHSVAPSWGARRLTEST